MRRLVVAVAAGLGVALVAASVTVAWVFGPDIMNHFKDTSAESTQIPTAQIGGSQPGSLVSATTMPQLDKDPDSGLWNSARVLYHSTSGDTGESTVVSGTVFTPKTPVPQGGWPVVARSRDPPPATYCTPVCGWNPAKEGKRLFTNRP